MVSNCSVPLIVSGLQSSPHPTPSNMLITYPLSSNFLLRKLWYIHHIDLGENCIRFEFFILLYRRTTIKLGAAECAYVYTHVYTCSHIHLCSHRGVHICLDLHAQVVTRAYVCAHIYGGAHIQWLLTNGPDK